MEVTLDKFGRILIPKKIRQLLGLVPGQVLELVPNEQNRTIDLSPKQEIRPTLIITEEGVPVFRFNLPQKIDFDVIELIKDSREERANQLWGHD